jgi:hypothetical protein
MLLLLMGALTQSNSTFFFYHCVITPSQLVLSLLTSKFMTAPLCRHCTTTTTSSSTTTINTSSRRLRAHSFYLFHVGYSYTGHEATVRCIMSFRLLPAVSLLQTRNPVLLCMATCLVCDVWCVCVFLDGGLHDAVDRERQATLYGLSGRLADFWRHLGRRDDV